MFRLRIKSQTSEKKVLDSLILVGRLPTTVLKGCLNGRNNKLLYQHPQIKTPSIFWFLYLRIIKVKNISKQQLDKHIQNIEALFINIDWGKKGQTINDFKNLKIDSFKLMEKGLIFIWAPKELIFQILKIMLEKDFFYVENLEIVHLNRQKAISLSKTCKGLKI